ncbi:MAG: hypothetical protein NC110_07405 [Ruminococcus sp.]|nr:hypothetical protein [Ruminococcus sp.]
MLTNEFEVSKINESMRFAKESFILEAENRFKRQLADVANAVCSKNGHSLLMLAGPSCSGKTTTARIFAEAIDKNNRKATIISLDDFYREQSEMTTFEDGSPDYETIDAFDVKLIAECLDSLVMYGKCMLPKFSFLTKSREAKLIETQLQKDEIVIVEGLHAINPLITDALDASTVTKLYVSVSSTVMLGNDVLLTNRELRLIRRLIRDYHFRATDVDKTLYLWNGVQKGEDRYIFPFSHLADVKIDSFHPYEPCVFNAEAIKLLDRIGEDSVYYDSAVKLKNKLSHFDEYGAHIVPLDSLLREFIG